MHNQDDPSVLMTHIFQLGTERAYVDGISRHEAQEQLVRRRGARWRASSYEGWQGTQDPVPEEPLQIPWFALFVAAVFLTALMLAGGCSVVVGLILQAS